MKTLIVVYRDDERAGGSVRVAEVLAHSLPARGIDLHIVVAYGEGGRLKGLLGDRCHFMRASGPRDLAAWRRYRRFIRKLAPDVVHYVDNVGWMALAGMWLPIKRINHQHFRPDVGPRGHKRFKQIRWLLGTADKIVAISFGAGRQLVEKCHIAPEKVAVVHNAVDLNYLSASKNQTDREKCVLGMAVRVVADKGIEDAFNLLTLLPDRFELVIAGDGPARTSLETLAANMGISARVRWVGSVRDISKFYAQIDFYLFMSWYEGFGLSVAEAMRCGRPIVGLLGDGEIAEEEYPLVTQENSILVNRSSPHLFAKEADKNVLMQLKEKIVELDRDYEWRSELTTNASNWVENKFSSELYGRRIHDVYCEVLQSKAV